jgi:hypothetical protein
MHIGCIGEPLSLLCPTLPQARSETLHYDSQRHVFALCDLPIAKVQDHQQGKPLLFFLREGAVTDDDLWRRGLRLGHRCVVIDLIVKASGMLESHGCNFGRETGH